MRDLEAVIRIPLREQVIALLLGLSSGAWLLYAGAQTPKWFFFLLFSLMAAALLVIDSSGELPPICA